MFSEEPGPTALRADMVRALAFSVEEISIESASSTERCIGALAAVWNGTQGFVAFLIRSLERPLVRRFAFAHPIESETRLEHAIEEGLGFAASLGFHMDDTDFSSLDAAHQDRRLERWNRFRKPERMPLPGPATQQREAEPELVGEEIVEDTIVEDTTFEDLIVGPGPQARAAGAVLGRIALVRQDDTEARQALYGRLLGFF